MKKVLCLFTVMLLLTSMALPVIAADFVPSITYKGGPEVQSAELDGQGVGDCVVITSIAEAEEKTTDITDEERALLLEVYEKLEDGSMTLPLDGDYVIRELVDVSFEFSDCREIEEHNHKDQQLKQEKVTLTVVFDLNVSKADEIVVMTYIDGKWEPIESVVNNGDGTITCVFEDVCPVAFAVKDTTSAENPKTGDMLAADMTLWVTLMVFSVAALAVLAPKFKKN